MEKHLERVAGYAESAYQQVSADLKHDLSFKVPLILFKTHSEFEQQNVASPDASSEGVGAFAEPVQHRMVLPIDDPPDLLYGLIVHELTHQFEFDIIPQQLIRRSVPLWVNEGLSDYEKGQWSPIDLMTVRDAAVADIVPKMSELEGYGGSSNPRLIYNLGHAVFEFIEAKFGKEGIRQFLFSLRKSVIGGGEDAYEEALRMKKDEFDQAFERYLKDRFKPFRDKERPADYGRNLAPNQEKTSFAEALSIAPSPSGDLVAAVTINRKDRELDIVLLSSKDGAVVRNLTSGFDKDSGYDHIVQYGERFEMPWLGWSPKGDRLAYFVRTEKERTLIIQNVLTRKIEERIPLKSVDEPESPAFAPDGKTIAFDALRDGIGDIFTVNLETKEIVNLTNDSFADMAPTYSPDGTYIVYAARVSGNQKLFRLDLDTTKKKTQLTFGTQDETAAQFVDDHTLVFASTATDPAIPLEPEVAKNGNIYNIWTLDLKTGELRQYTDALGGNWSPVVLNDGKANRIAFISYYKSEYGIHTLERKEPLHTAATSDFGAPAPIIDFQAPLQHTLVTGNTRKKGMFEKMFLEGRPPINVGVTSNGDVFGGSQVSFGDVLGDQQFNLFAASILQYRTLSLSYVNLAHRFQYALQGFSQTQFFYGQLGGVFYNPAFAPLISRDQAIATRTVRGGTAFGIYPFSRYRRVELSGGLVQLNEEYNDPNVAQVSQQYQQQQFGQQIFHNGTLMPLGVAFVQETTVFREFGPLAGNTMRLAYDASPKIGSLLSRQTLDGDARHSHSRLQEHGRLPRLHLLRRQLGNARLRLSPVRGPERRLRERRAPLPADRGGAHADRRGRRRPGRVLRQHRRGVVQEPVRHRPVRGVGRVQVLHEQARGVQAGHGRPGRFNRQRRGRRLGQPDPHLRSGAHHLGLPPPGRPRVVRHRAGDVRARVPDPLRLVMANAVQQGLGRRRVRQLGRQRRVPQGAVRAVDRLRLLAWRRQPSAPAQGGGAFRIRAGGRPGSAPAHLVWFD
jgi:hypothetical protein